MKALQLIFTLVIVGCGTTAMAQSSATPPTSYTDKLMPEIEVGTLMCKDDHGKLIKCNGDEFDRIAGLATSSPYITINKKDPKDTAPGFVAKAVGDIAVGDYVKAAADGLVQKCDSKVNAIAKVVSASGNEIRVRLLSK